MKYYFDNTQGLKNYVSDMVEVGITTANGQWMHWYGDGYSWQRSEFLDKLSYYDPDAEITYDANDKDAIRLIEICSFGDVEILSRLLDRIELTKNTIVYSSTEPFYTSPEIQARYNVKVISCASQLVQQPRRLAFTSFVVPFILAQGLCQWYLPEPDVDTWFRAQKNYLFLNLNNRFNFGRFALLLHLHYYNLIGPHNNRDLSRGQVSFNYNHLKNLQSLGLATNTSGEMQNIELYIKQYPEFEVLAKRLLAPKIALTVPEVTNYPDKLSNHASPHNPEWYANSWFSLVSECNQRQQLEGCFMSEKITKAILHGHPFIIYGDSGQMPWLKSIGFDNFDWLFGDATDNPPVPQGQSWLKVKLDNIVTVIKSLNNKTFINNQQQIKDAILHNYRHLKSDNLRQQCVNDWRRIIEYLVD